MQRLSMVGSVQVHNRRESVALDMKAYSHLSAQERIRIDELRNREGLGVCQIALRIGRDKLFCFNVCSTGSAVFFRSVG